MPTTKYILAYAIGFAMLLGQGPALSHAQTVSSPANDETVRDGAKVTVLFHITPQNNPTRTYSDTEKFVQGQHMIPPGLEQRVAGMHPGEVTTFSLSAEEAFGPYDETKIEIIPPADLPPDAREGDTLDDGTGRTAKVVRIFPEKAVLDLNHPLAGQPLIVTLQIMTIENPGDRIDTP
jgi:peptidylprolyl isomerase